MNNEDNREFHTWRAWRFRARNKQLDYIVGRKDIRSTTWYLNQVRLRTWGHFPVITRIEGRELQTKKCVKRWAGWTPVSEAEKAKFQELVVCPRSDHNDAAQRDAEEGEGLALPQDRLVGAAAEVRATTTSSRNRNKFCVLEDIRKMASDAATCRNPVKKKHLRKIVREARREFEAGRAVLPRRKKKQTSGHEALGQRSRQRGQRRVDRRGQSPL